MAWTAEKIKQLKKLWLKGKSTVEIGKELGISKNAVVGKVHRLELAARPSPIKREVKKSVPKQRVIKKDLKPQNITLMDLKLNSCRWPIGDPKDDDFHFCGADSVTGKPYCAEHCKLAYTSLKELTLQNAKAKKEKEEQQALLEQQADALLATADAQEKKAKSASKRKPTPEELEAEANALLAAAEGKVEKKKSSRKKSDI